MCKEFPKANGWQRDYFWGDNGWGTRCWCFDINQVERLPNYDPDNSKQTVAAMLDTDMNTCYFDNVWFFEFHGWTSENNATSPAECRTFCMGNPKARAWQWFCQFRFQPVNLCQCMDLEETKMFSMMNRGKGAQGSRLVGGFFSSGARGLPDTMPAPKTIDLPQAADFCKPFDPECLKPKSTSGGR